MRHYLNARSHRLRLVLAAGLAGWAICCAAAESPRTWTDAAGRKVEATLVAVEKDKVRLKRTTGAEIVVSLDRLSKADRDYLAARNSDEPRPPPAAARTSPRAAECVVLVATQRDGGKTVKPAIVFHRDQQRAYVALPVDRLGGNLGEQVVLDKSSMSIICGREGQTRELKAELVVPYPHRGHWILAAPAKDMPSPPAVDPAVVPSESTAVVVTGYAVASANSPAPFTLVSEEATLKRIYRNAALEVERYYVEGKAITALRFGFVTTAAGAPIGHFMTEPVMARERPRQGLLVLPARVPSELLQPEVHHVAFAPRTGDRTSIEFEFVAYVSDPLAVLDSPRMTVTKVQEPERRDIRHFPLEEEEEAPRKPDNKSVELKLVKQAPSAQFTAQFPAQGRLAQLTTWVGRHADVNLGPVQQYRYVVRVDGTGKGGTPQPMWHAGARYETANSFASGQRRRPDIPGLDGRPLDAIRPTEHKGGGMQITGEATRVKEPPAAVAAQPPEPAKSSTSFADKPSGEGDWETVQLAKQGPQLGSPGRPCEAMAFAPNGKWLYLLDAKGVLYKIRLSDFVAEVSLDTGGVSRSLSFSKEGLLVAVTHAHAVWIVDPETLRVVRQIPVHNVSLVEGSPTSSIAFAAGTRPQSTEPDPSRPDGRPGRSGEPDVRTDPWGGGTGRPALWMLDLAKGCPLHCIPGGTDAEYAPFNGGAEHLYVRANGKYLYMGAGWIRRYRIEGEELVFEERCPPLPYSTRQPIVVSEDNKLATTHGPTARIVLVDPLRLSEEKLSLGDDMPMSAIGFDPATGNIYAASHFNKVIVFSARGGKVNELGIADMTPSRLLVHPEGRSFVVWGEKKITYCRMRKPS